MGCTDQAIEEELKHRGLYAASEQDAEGRGSARRAGGRAESAGADPDEPAGVTLTQLAEAKRLDVGFLRGLGLHDTTHKGKPAVAIPYRDRDGKVMFERLRIGLTGKRFWQPAGVSVVPYGRDRLAQARAAGRVLIVEGETDCFACWLHEESAYGLPGKGTWKPEFAADLEGIADVWLWREPGAADLVDRVAHDVTRLRVIEAPAGLKDLAEAHARGLHVPSVLATLREASGADEPAAAAHDDAPGGHEPEPDTSGPDWPAPLAAEAFYGLAGRIVRKIEPTTESDPAALLLQLLVFFGNCAGRTPHFVVEADRHGLNEFMCLVGPTSKARKGTAEGRIRALFRAVAEDWLISRVQSGLSSGEGFIWEIRDPIIDGLGTVTDPGVEDKRLLCVEGELASILRRAERDGNSLSAELRLAWDSKPLGSMVKTRPGKCREPHVSIVGHVTREELTRYMTRTEAANGFGNRFLWVCVRRARILPFGAEPPNLNAEVKELHDALDFAGGLQWQIPFDMTASEAWEAVYGPLSAGKPGLVGAILGRAEAHARRLATAYAVLDQSSVVAPDHLMAALAVWDYCEASAVHIFGESLGDPDADEVLELIRAAGSKGMRLEELHHALQNNWPNDRKSRALRALKRHDLIREEKGPTSGKGGRPATRYFATNPHERTPSYLLMAQKAMGYAGNAGNAETPAGVDSEFEQGRDAAEHGYAETPPRTRP